ncbi:regulatory protein, tetR family [Saccharopolyspora antimicrobica]|uniref:Regulatory protein, tetR family n=1 Tax=Saccharopolyspora antimicrobica TaxID=455193 RepID=A0A1I4XLP2_9PSEU|nr:TetR/AcrR family transcriptional regulator [Saccharopolyspora antimicrobica]RKT84563.1 TetR family transcriptional regulator [Saccharopolyspora antimicrobica]SFN26742.1 regulatory protein, tetR family [Saccharopolyspora antimicrobica]
MPSEETEPDPSRTLALLWGVRDRPKRGPRPGLDVDRIVQAAIDLADREGVAALTMRRVAAELGVGTASLYTYVPGRPDLIAMMLDQVIGRTSLPHELPGDWRAKFEAWATEDWAMFHRHPWVPAVASEPVLPGPNAFAWYDSTLRVLAGTGLSEQEKVAVIETLDNYVRGTASNKQDRHKDSSWLAKRDQALERLVDFDAYPHLAHALTSGGNPAASETFELGLQRVLDGIAVLIEARAQA